MLYIPGREDEIRDNQVFEALDLDYLGLEKVKKYYEDNNIQEAKKALVEYFYKRQNIKYHFDYRQGELQKINSDICAYLWPSSMGLEGKLKELHLHIGNKMMENIFVPNGQNDEEVFLGNNLEHMIHFNFADIQKGSRKIFNMLIRGYVFEGLAVLYHETSDEAVAYKFQELVQKFFEEYPLIIENKSPDAMRVQYTEDREIMSVAWLSLVYMDLLYTRLPYTKSVEVETTFNIIKRLWFYGMQFRRFDEDTYRPFNHHMWERGIAPIMYSLLLPEFKDFRPMKEIGKKVFERHILEDFAEDGGYSEHSIGYWAEAAMGEMISKLLNIAKHNNQVILSPEAQSRIDKNFDILASIAPPTSAYTTIGDKAAPDKFNILELGVYVNDNKKCQAVLKAHHLDKKNEQEIEVDNLPPLHFYSGTAGYLVGRDNWTTRANYFMLSAKNNCSRCGHNHMDMLSLELIVKGKRMITEPYAGDMYRKFIINTELRGYQYNMESHNTVLAFGKPIAPNKDYANKWGVYKPNTYVTKFESRATYLHVKGYHVGYTNCEHHREILFMHNKGWIIKDKIRDGSRMEAPHIQRWHLERGVSLHQYGEKILVLENKKSKLLCMWEQGEHVNVKMWKKEDLYPSIIQHKEELNWIIDCEFKDAHMDNEEAKKIATHCLMLDISELEELPSLSQLEDYINELKDREIDGTKEIERMKTILGKKEE